MSHRQTTSTSMGDLKAPGVVYFHGSYNLPFTLTFYDEIKVYAKNTEILKRTTLVQVFTTTGAWTLTGLTVQPANATFKITDELEPDFNSTTEECVHRVYFESTGAPETDSNMVWIQL